MLYYYYYYYFAFFGGEGGALAAYGGSQARDPIRLQLSAYATATATPDSSHVYDLHQRSRQCPILDPLNKARDQTHILMDTSWICFRCTTIGTPKIILICQRTNDHKVKY